MVRWILGVILLFSTFYTVEGCRFTVREIGFTTLSQDIYSLIIVDEKADAMDQQWKRVHKRLSDSNIRLAVLHPEHDAAHPFVKQVVNNGVKLPAKVLLAPDGRLLELSEYSVSELLGQGLDSPVCRRLRNELPEVFSVILYVPGKDEQVNRKVEDVINRDCDQIENSMPHMPKEVKKGPVVVTVLNEEILQETVPLWALGIEQQPNEPMAFVLYGRGRIMGTAVSASSILEGNLFKLMSMIGADCECGLDRKWMLGHQLPLFWSVANRQHLMDEVGFDVDNPMILAEMSRILAKEVDPQMAGNVSFGPEVVDLNNAFAPVPKISYEEKRTDRKIAFWWIYVGGVGILIVGSGFYLFFRNNK